MSELSVGQLKGLTVNNNVINVPSGHTLYAPGHIIQVVQSVKSDTMAVAMSGQTGTPTTSNTVFLMSAEITPKFSNSKVLVTANIRYTGVGSTPALILFRNSIPVGVGDAANNRRRSTAGTGLQLDGNQISGVGDISYFDEPTSISPVTYSIRFWSDNTQITYVNRSSTDLDTATGVRTISTLTLLEVAQ
jgi:hypothetical protein